MLPILMVAIPTLSAIVAAVVLLIILGPKMSAVSDTTSATITGKDGTADFTATIGGSTYSLKCHIDMFRVREVTEMTDASTFCVECVADQEPGRSQLQFEIAGLGKKDGAASMILLPAPQNVPIVATYSAGCTISFNANFTEIDAVRVVNQNMRFAGRGLSKGTYVVTWDRAAGP